MILIVTFNYNSLSCCAFDWQLTGRISLAEFGPKWMEATAFGETDTMAIFMKYFTMLGDPTDTEHITPRNVMEIWEDVLMAGKSNTSNEKNLNIQPKWFNFFSKTNVTFIIHWPCLRPLNYLSVWMGIWDIWLGINSLRGISFRNPFVVDIEGGMLSLEDFKTDLEPVSVSVVLTLKLRFLVYCFVLFLKILCCLLNKTLLCVVKGH